MNMRMTEVTAVIMAMIYMTVIMQRVAVAAAGAGAGVGLSLGPESYCSNGPTQSSGSLSRWVEELLPNTPTNTTTLKVSLTQITEIPPRAFSSLKSLRSLFVMYNMHLTKIDPYAFADIPKLSKIIISYNLKLETISSYAFYNLPQLRKLTITNSKDLKAIDHNAFVNLRKLTYLSISNTGITVFPVFSRIHSASSDLILELTDNLNLDRVPANSIRGVCTQSISEMRLVRNGIRKVERGAFTGTRMSHLTLRNNKQLVHIDPGAFSGSSELQELDVSFTALSALPESALGSLRTLVAESSLRLKTLPPLDLFISLKVANLTYPSHCCAFKDLKRSRPKQNPLIQELCLREDMVSLEPSFYMSYCQNPMMVSCLPESDAFNPCEDIMDNSTLNPWILRCLIWIVSLLALMGNLLVLLITLGSPLKLTVPRFLMCNLAFGDLCMGIYLMMIASKDIHTRGQYYNYALDWQMGAGCNAAGFFTVFASELSVFTLTFITLERWHTITQGLRLERLLRLRHACFIMAGGWGFAFLSALLPTLGVSSYSKVSICLPMDVETLGSQVYVVILLILNLLAFLCVCSCYLSIYLAVRKPSATPVRADMCVAKRMAVIIFTNFLCMVPISFFAISAALRQPFIGVSEAKLLLVILYPINSCCNPFIYAFLTQAFRRDTLLIIRRFGLCRERVHNNRRQSLRDQQVVWRARKSSHGRGTSPAAEPRQTGNPCVIAQMTDQGQALERINSE